MSSINLLSRKLAELAAQESFSAKDRIRKETLGRVFVEAHLKLYEDVEDELSTVVSNVIQTHLREAELNLGDLTGSKEATEQISELICPTKEWTEDLINASMPILAKAMADSAVSRWILLGGDMEEENERGFKTTAMEWLQSVGITPPSWLQFTVPIWMQEAIEIMLRASFQQPYWDDIAGTTKNDVERILRVGLDHGETLQTMARKLENSFPYEYSYKRGMLIARTETGNALGSGAEIAFQKLKEDLGPEAGKYVQKKWVSILDDRTRDDHARLNGVIANSEGKWLLEGKWIPWPAHYSLSPSQRCNCRCTSVVEFGVQPEDMTGLPYND